MTLSKALTLLVFTAASMVTGIFEEEFLSSSLYSSYDAEELCDCSSVQCPPAPENCAHGLVTAPDDLCGCCFVCGNEEWNYCDPDPIMYPEYFTYYMPWEKMPPKPMWDPQLYKFGRCGWGLQCTLRDDMGPFNSLPVFVCTCQDEDIVCGSDGKTYENPCELREKAAKNGTAVAIKKRAMCPGVPVMVTPPMNYSGDSPIYEDTDMMLSCEVNANPPATITWTKNGNLIRYMGPNRRKSIHSRPGISIYTRTSWLKVYGTRKSDIGTYKCVATNSYGSTIATSIVDVVPRNAS